jgi:hypothetical protein
MSENFLQENTDIDPRELQDILIGFLGSTYGEVAKFDNNIINANPTLSHKKHEFERLAERVMQEAIPQNRIHAPQNHQQVHHHHPQVRHHAPPPQHIPEQHQQIDPNQMEFSFDNSVTALSINEKLEDIQKKLKRLDKAIENVVSLLEKHEIKNK